MSLIREWAVAHHIPMSAVLDLEHRMAIDVQIPLEGTGSGEAYVQSVVRLEAPKHRVHLFRNNVGALKDKNGRMVRYGIANDNKYMNAVLKSGDLIGWRHKLVTADMVGHAIALFVSRECKHEGWQYSGTAHEVAQLNWINLVNSHGGDAKFCTGLGSF